MTQCAFGTSGPITCGPSCAIRSADRAREAAGKDWAHLDRMKDAAEDAADDLKEAVRKARG